MKNGSRSKRIAELKQQVRRLERRVDDLLNESHSLVICRTMQHELRMKPSQAERFIRALQGPVADDYRRYLPPRDGGV